MQSDKMFTGSSQLFASLKKCERCVDKRTTEGTSFQFFKAVTVWINKPHVVNRRLCGSQIVVSDHCQKKTCVETLVNTWCENKQFDEQQQDAKVKSFEDLNDEPGPFTVILRELIPKSEFFPKITEVVVFDHVEKKIWFIPIDRPCGDLQATLEIAYSIHFKDGRNGGTSEIELQWSCDHDENEIVRRQVTSKWLSSVLMNKLMSWSLISDISTKVTSLQLVQVDKYKDIYVRLKNTYGRELVKNWTERTDPNKFVYEDVAIASYLLLLWEEDREKKQMTKKQTFVDLGCGNGLLVYILTKEGHKGLGIDLRKRKIWDTFGPDIDLREGAIKPSSEHLFPDYDWIIGNHSDELTPWIPVIAARSSYNCSFFVLPCCHHDFVGKYAQTEKGKSMYSSYLNYVQEIVKQCGFKPECDILRIPSTKRTCYIGKERTYESHKETTAEDRREAFISERTARIAQLHVTKVKLMELETQEDLHSSIDLNACLKKKAHDSTNVLETSFHRDVMDGNLSQTFLDQMITLHPESPSSNLNSLTSIDFNREGAALASLDLSQFGSSSDQEQALNSLESLNTDQMNSSAAPVMNCSSELASPNSSKSLSSVDTNLSKPNDGLKRLNDDSSELPLSYETEEKMIKKPRVGEFSVNTNFVDMKANLSDGHKFVTSKSHDMQGVVANRASNQMWMESFQIRNEQIVRNCQSVPETTKQTIVDVVFHEVMAAGDSSPVQLEGGRTWNKGGSVPLGTAVKLLDTSLLQQLKSECGGLQTLLRNHSHIFQVTQGKIQLRDFTMSDPWQGRNPQKLKGNGKPRDTFKTKMCWFLIHHPDGCPRPSEKCRFAHTESELRQPCKV